MGRAESKLAKIYSRVQGRDRFRLAVDAAARGRADEVDRLLIEASWAPGSHIDPDMCEAFEEFRALLREFDARTRTVGAWLTLLHDLRPQIDRVVLDAERGDPPFWSAPILQGIVKGLTAFAAEELRALELALGDLGQDRLGLAPEATLAVQPPWVHVLYETYRAEVDQASPDEETVAKAREGLLQGWGPEGLGAVHTPGEEA